MTRHIGILFEFPTLNGGEHSMLAVLQTLQKSHFRFTAIAPDDGPLPNRLQSLGIPVIPFRVRSESGVKRDQTDLDRDLNAILQAQQPDLLHSNSLSMSRLIGGFKSRSGIVLKTTGHLRDIIKLSRSAIRDLNRNDGLVAVSKATQDFHVAQGLTKNVCRVIHNGIDRQAFETSTTDDRPELFRNVDPKAKIVLNVGQICLRKNQLHLAESVCEMLRHRDDVHLALVGERHSTKQESIDYEQAIHACFEAEGRIDHLHTFGFRDDVARFMNACDVLVHTSRQEPFGRTLLEAAISELPIIATDVGGTSEMLRPGSEAILILPDEHRSLISAIEDVFSNPRDAEDRAANARRRVTTEFSIQNAATALADFWNAQFETSASE